MHDDLSALVRPRSISTDRYALDVPVGWGQARGTFGGLLLGALADATGRSEPDGERHLRSITAEIAGPVVPGAAAIECRIVRRGSGVSTWTATLEAGGEPLVVASVVLGRARDIDRTWQPEPPVMPPWRECPAVPAGLPGVPEFTQHYEFRPCGPIAFAGGKEAKAMGWIRPRVASTGLGTPEVVATADAWWPAVYSIETAPRPIATIAFTAQSFLGGRVLSADEPLFHRAHAVASAAGYFVEMRELWTAAGELVLLNQQTFVWIR